MLTLWPTCWTSMGHSVQGSLGSLVFFIGEIMLRLTWNILLSLLNLNYIFHDTLFSSRLFHRVTKEKGICNSENFTRMLSLSNSAKCLKCLVAYFFTILNWYYLSFQDLSKLGRDLKHVLIVDNSPASYSFHPENAVRSLVLFYHTCHNFIVIPTLFLSVFCFLSLVHTCDRTGRSRKRLKCLVLMFYVSSVNNIS